MHPREPLDGDLTDVLGPAAAAALARWAQLMRVRFGLERSLVNGRSGATVSAVYEWQHDGSARKMILKRDAVDDDEIGRAEYARQRTALAEVPASFAACLSTLAHEPIAVGDGTWITFQDIVGGGPDAFHVLTSLLAGAGFSAVSGLTVEPVPCDRESFVAVCVDVVRGVLADWAREPKLVHLSVSEFLRRHLEDRSDPGRPLHEQARRWPGATVSLPGEPADLPNPFRFVLGLPPELDVRVPALLGPGHGDLHTENILVSHDRKRFVLIDLARYQSDAPLTRDPVCLVLSVVNRTMDELSQVQRQVLLDAFTAPPEQVQWGMLPPWLTMLLTRTREAELQWIGGSRLGDEWRRVAPLSTLAGALIFAARRTTSEAGREWFIHLAARSARTWLQSPQRGGATSARQFGAAALGNASSVRPNDVSRNLVKDPVDGPAESTPGAVPVPPSGGTGLGDLCHDLGTKRRKAADRGRSEDLKRLMTRARLGYDIRTEYERLMNDIDYDGGRSVLPALAGGRPVPHEAFHCPLGTAPCGRVERRGPNGQTPFCFIQYGEMTLSLE